MTSPHEGTVVNNRQLVTRAQADRNKRTAKNIGVISARPLVSPKSSGMRCPSHGTARFFDKEIHYTPGDRIITQTRQSCESSKNPSLIESFGYSADSSQRFLASGRACTDLDAWASYELRTYRTTGGSADETSPDFILLRASTPRPSHPLGLETSNSRSSWFVSSAFTPFPFTFGTGARPNTDPLGFFFFFSRRLFIRVYLFRDGTAAFIAPGLHSSLYTSSPLSLSLTRSLSRRACSTLVAGSRSRFRSMMPLPITPRAFYSLNGETLNCEAHSIGCHLGQTCI